MSLNTWISVEFIHVYRGFCVNGFIGFTTEHNYTRKSITLSRDLCILFFHLIRFGGFPFEPCCLILLNIRNYSGLSRAKPQSAKKSICRVWR